jgi:membrane-bound metal-dependent hydrolase YbcI (DUF457 family)
MPSPVGHALAGLALGLAGTPRPVSHRFSRVLGQPLTLICVALATLPDADLLIPGFHRRASHSLGATIAVTILAIVVTGWVTRKESGARGWGLGGSGSGLRASGSGFGRIAWSVVLLCAAAHASHILLDWLGADRSQPAGIQALWPWSDIFYMSGWDVFPQIERRRIFSAESMAINLNAFVWEILLMGPLVAASYAWHVRNGNSEDPKLTRPR